MIRRLAPGDGALFAGMLDLFGAAFEDEERYGARRPDGRHVGRLLASPGFIALVALRNGQVTGALVAYELPKFEQARSELYIYDLAVAVDHRRQGIATALIAALGDSARQIDAAMIYVQADREDDGAVALYSRFGEGADVLHFDIPVR